MPHTVIPASTGWTFCSPIHEQDGCIKSFAKKPIVAWIVEDYAAGPSGCASSYCFPVSPLESIESTDEFYAILSPLGEFEIPQGPIFNTEQEAIDELERMRLAEQKMRAYMESKK